MFFFFHLMVGVATGLLISELLRSKRWLLPVAVGSILSDLIDKPLGHIILHDTLGNGRIIGHSLLFVLLIIVVVIVWSRYNGSITGYGLVVGVLIHQILDSMWVSHQTWFFPLFGMFPKRDLPGYFVNSFWRELTSPQEWLALLFLALIGVIILGEWYYLHHPFSSTLTRFKSPLMTTGGLIAVGFGLMVLFNLQNIRKSPFAPLVEGGDPLILALALIWCGLIFVYIAWRRIHNPDSPLKIKS
jgi:membrane-bound metal-dependent hydrolase YbcI (DUF457 family)